MKNVDLNRSSATSVVIKLKHLNLSELKQINSENRSIINKILDFINSKSDMIVIYYDEHAKNRMFNDRDNSIEVNVSNMIDKKFVKEPTNPLISFFKKVFKFLGLRTGCGELHQKIQSIHTNSYAQNNHDLL